VTVVAVAEAVALVAVVFLCLGHLRGVERANAQERRALADRIQRPELLPARETVAFAEPPPREDDELSTVGQIRISDTYGTDG
jgi:hypothetical protein